MHLTRVCPQLPAETFYGSDEGRGDFLLKKPFTSGPVSEAEYEPVQIPHNWPQHKRGNTKNDFCTVGDIAMLGVTTLSRVPLRIATLPEFVLSGFSLFASLIHWLLNLVLWDELSSGNAPVLIGMFFFASVQLFFSGLPGEYVGAILPHLMKLPLIVEREWINVIEPSNV